MHGSGVRTQGALSNHPAGSIIIRANHKGLTTSHLDVFALTQRAQLPLVVINTPLICFATIKLGDLPVNPSATV